MQENILAAAVPDPARGANSAPTDPLASGEGAGFPLSKPSPPRTPTPLLAF